jgi:hypothetical protein
MARAALVLPAASAPRRGFATRHVALCLVAALALGIGASLATLTGAPPVGRVEIGPWTTYPLLGSSDVDPYARALLVRQARLPLGLGEGLSFTATRDSAGGALDGGCRYRIEGATLPSRGWTLTVADRDGRALAGRDAASLTDASLLGDETGRIRIAAGSTALSGNWLRLPAGERFTLLLRFYDTPVSGGIAALDASALPAITVVSCAR